jgi:hypothetical protein
VPDVIVHTDNVLCHTEKFDSPSEHPTSLASLPQGSRGQCGPGSQSLVLVCDCGAQMSEPKVAELWRSVGVPMSAGQGAHLLRKDQVVFHGEKAAFYHAGLASSPWQPLDDTRPRGNGQHGYGHMVCTPLSTAAVTTAAKDRRTIIDVLTHHRPRRFLRNAEAWDGMEGRGVSAVRRRQVEHRPAGTLLDEATRQAWREAHRPGVGPQQRPGSLDATAVAAYHATVEVPVRRLWVCDEAPPCPLSTEELARCWVHAGRHSFYHSLHDPLSGAGYVGSQELLLGDRIAPAHDRLWPWRPCRGHVRRPRTRRVVDRTPVSRATALAAVGSDHTAVRHCSA